MHARLFYKVPEGQTFEGRVIYWPLINLSVFLSTETGQLLCLYAAQKPQSSSEYYPTT